MDTLTNPGPLNEAYRKNFVCDFCLHRFDTLAEKNAHLIDHFEQQICQKCEQNLLRIGDNFYILHATVTCISSTDIKQETELCEQSYNESFLREQHPVDGHLQFDDNCINKRKINHDLIQMDTVGLSPTIVHIDASSVTLRENETNSLNGEFSSQESVDDTNIKDELDEAFTYTVSSVEEQTFDMTLTNKPGSNRFKSEKVAEKHADLECDICKKVFQTIGGIRQHMSTHGVQEKYSCKKCGSQNLTKKSYKSHHRKPKYMCHECNRPCCKFGQLKDHYKRHAGANPCDGIDLASKLPIKQARAQRNVKKFQCTVDGCTDMISTNTRSHHMARKHQSAQSTCDVCMKCFASKEAVRAHIFRLHVPSAKQFKCKLCGTAHLTQSRLDWHIKLSHIKEHNFMCSECGKTFCQKNQLIIHTMNHTGEKPYQCTYEGCSKRFRAQANRIEHMRSHTGERPYGCPVTECARRFSYAVDLRRHKFSAHGIFTKKYPCPIEICSEIFPENMLLKKHMKKHENNF